MKIYKTQTEVDADIIDGVLTVDDSVKFEFNLAIKASLRIAGNIDAGNIDAGNINAWNINAGNIDAWNIIYFAFCISCKSIKCLTIKGTREKHLEPQCLDGSLTITGENP